MNWNFEESEYLVVIIALIYQHNFFSDQIKDHEKCRMSFALMQKRNLFGDDFNNDQLKDLHTCIEQKKVALELFNKALEGINNKKIKYTNKNENTAKNPAFIKINSLKFLEWVKKNDITIPILLQEAASKRNIINQYSRKHYKKCSLTCDDLYKLQHQPLWDLPTAIIYLYGFKPGKSKSMNEKLMKQNSDFKKVYDFAFDASHVQTLQIHRKSSREGMQHQVKPDSFIQWSRTLGIDFPIYALDPAPNWEELYKDECVKHAETQKELKKIKNKEKPINPKEKTSFQKIVIAMAVKHYKYNPKLPKNSATKNIKTTIESYGMSLDDTPILNCLRDSAEQIPSEIWEDLYPS